VQELFVNEKRIEHEARALLTTIARYRKQTDQWLAATNEINSVLKVTRTDAMLLPCPPNPNFTGLLLNDLFLKKIIK